MAPAERPPRRSPPAVTVVAGLRLGLDATLAVLDLTSLEVAKTISLADGTPGPAEFPGAFDELSLISPLRSRSRPRSAPTAAISSPRS